MLKTLHVAQDTHGYWFLSLEDAQEKLELDAHQVSSCDQLISHALDLAREHGLPPTALAVERAHRAPPLTEAERPDHYEAPTPRKAVTDAI